jgi:hypothetical protein
MRSSQVTTLDRWLRPISGTLIDGDKCRVVMWYLRVHSSSGDSLLSWSGRQHASDKNRCHLLNCTASRVSKELSFLRMLCQVFRKVNRRDILLWGPQTHTHTYTHTHIHGHTHTHTHIQTYTLTHNTHTYTHTHIHTHTYTLIHTHTYTHTHIHTHKHTRTHTHIHTYIHTHTRTHIHTASIFR